MVRLLNISLNETDVTISTRLRSKSATLTSKLADKMLTLMQDLQEKAQGNVPSSRVKESIQNPSAEIQLDKVIGTLDWGGVPVQYMEGITYDLAQIFEKGAKAHPVNPLTDPITGQGTRLHRKGAKTRYGTGASVLHWEEGGKDVFRPYTFHPALPATNFMANAIAGIRSEFEEQLMGVVYDALE